MFKFVNGTMTSMFQNLLYVQDHKEMTDAENGSVASFGTLRRAHISRNKVSRTSFYLRVGALGEAYFLISKISNLASVLKMLPVNCICFDMFHFLFDSC